MTEPVKQLDHTYDHVLQCARVAIAAFKPEMESWWGGDQADPDTLLHSWARLLHRELLLPGRQLHGIYHASTMIGFSIWVMPEQFRSKSSWLAKATTLRYNLIDFLINPHPLYNDRKFDYMDLGNTNDLPPNTREALDNLAKLGKHVRMALYRADDMCCLKWFAIDPAYQRRGLGIRLFRESLDSIPRDKIKFSDTVYGPQKLCVKSSKAGLQFYKSLGFEETVPGADVDHVHLVRNR